MNPKHESGRFVVDTWSVSRRHVVGISSVCGRYIVGMSSVCRRYVVGMWSVYRRYVVGMWSVCGWQTWSVDHVPTTFLVQLVHFTSYSEYVANSCYDNEDDCENEYCKLKTPKPLRVCKIRTCVRTCDGWPNGFASRLASSRKSQTVVNLTHIQLTRDQFVLTCVGWPNGERLAYEFELDQSHRKSSQVKARQRK